MGIFMSQTKTNDKYHVPNLSRAIKIIELLSEHPEGLNATEITSKIKVPRNSVFRITQTLLEHGYLIRDEETKTFQLSQKLLTLGYAALSEQSLIEKSLAVMRKLRDQYKETVPLGILHGSEGLVVEEVQGLHSFRFVLEPGRRFHLHTAAPGKAMLAFLPDDEQDALIKKIRFKKYSTNTITEKDLFRKELRKIRRKGYAVDHAEEIQGMHCVGAPIFNRTGYPIAAIWITGPAQRILEKDFSQIGEAVKKGTMRISQSLGYRPVRSGGDR
jgi:DNA-binding IclR family transcriptional regulator